MDSPPSIDTMQSGIFAVVTIGPYRLYIGETHLMEARWKPILAQLEQGTHPHRKIQQVWNQVEGKRRFNFYTRQDLTQDHQFIGRKQFLTDIGLV